MGATNLKKLVRDHKRDFANSIDANAVHGSDSVASAKREIEFFFSLRKFAGRDRRGLVSPED